MSNTSKPAGKARLGRGLSSLIANSAAITTDNQQYQGQTPDAQPGKAAIDTPKSSVIDANIPIHQIKPNPYQPRRTMDDTQLAELTESVAAEGILQPLIIAPAKDPNAEQPYVLIAGQRRLRAAAKAGLDAVPCVVRQATEQQILQWAIIENIQREDLNPIERASAYREYIDRFELTQAQVAEHLGIPRATVANHLRLMDLPDSIQELVIGGAVTFGHAKVLASLGANPQLQLKLARKVAADGLSVRRLEAIVNDRADKDPDNTPAKAGPVAKAPYIRDLEQQLTASIGTRVRIHPGRAKNTGRIVIDFYSLDDFDRISGDLGLSVDS